jgi:cellulose synthase/poly-beta-1,6-N-acetylglucosamine synthase-like glycosyltransferase
MTQDVITIGIPTYYGGPSLVETVKSIRANSAHNQARVIVCVDGVPLKKPIEKALKKLAVEIVFSQVRGGQVARIKQIINLCKTPLIVLTQDDVSLGSQTLEKIVDTFTLNPKVTMVAASELPTKPKKLLEKILEVGKSSALWIGEHWNQQDNYLLVSGRCLAFKTSHVQKFFLPEEIINSDSYMYFENKRLNGTCMYVKAAVVYNPLPQKIKEHVNQSRKFAISQLEAERYFKQNLDREYTIPPVLIVKSLILGFIKNPFTQISYVAINLYARVAGRNLFKNASRFWDTDISTKRTKPSKVVN